MGPRRKREVLGFAVGDSEGQRVLDRLPAHPQSRGLSPVQLVISDAHVGLRQAISSVLVGAAGQCLPGAFPAQPARPGPQGSAEMVAAAVRTIFAQPKAEIVREQLDTIAGMLGRQFPKVETMLRDAAPGVLAFADFPPSHWKKIWSPNPLDD